MIKSHIIIEGLHQVHIDEKYDYLQDFASEEEAESFVKNNKNISYYEITPLNNGDYRVSYDLKEYPPEEVLIQQAYDSVWGKNKTHDYKWVEAHKRDLKGMTVYYLYFNDPRNKPYEGKYYKDLKYMKAQMKHKPEGLQEGKRVL